MTKLKCCLLLCIIFISQSLSFAQSTQKNALVIANGGYKTFSLLPHLVAEARDLKQTLESLQFKVTLAENTDITSMKSIINTFCETVNREGGIAVFFFGGYAVQYQGKNYLLPVEITDINNLNLNTVVDFSTIISQMKAESNIAILDASRDIPFAFSNHERGLAPIENLPENCLVIYSAQVNSVARTGVFMSNFLNAIKQNISLSNALIEINTNVSKKTKGNQNIAVFNSIKTDIFLAENPKVVQHNMAKNQAPVSIEIQSDFTGELYLNGDYLLSIEAGRNYFLQNIPAGEQQFDFKMENGSNKIVIFFNPAEKRSFQLSSSGNGVYWEGQARYGKKNEFPDTATMVGLSNKFSIGEVVLIKNQITREEITVTIIGQQNSPDISSKVLLTLSPDAAKKISIKNFHKPWGEVNIVTAQKRIIWKENPLKSGM